MYVVSSVRRWCLWAFLLPYSCSLLLGSSWLFCLPFSLMADSSCTGSSDAAVELSPGSPPDESGSIAESEDSGTRHYPEHYPDGEAARRRLAEVNGHRMRLDNLLQLFSSGLAEWICRTRSGFVNMIILGMNVVAMATSCSLFGPTCWRTLIGRRFAWSICLRLPFTALWWCSRPSALDFSTPLGLAQQGACRAVKRVFQWAEDSRPSASDFVHEAQN